MQKLVLRWVINAIALWVAITIVPGISGPKDWLSIFGAALVFGFVNALIRPIIKLLTCPLIILTLGLGTLLINALMLWLTSLLSVWIGEQFGASIGFTLDGFWPAFWGALVISVVSVALSLLVRDELKGRRSRPRS